MAKIKQKKHIKNVLQKDYYKNISLEILEVCHFYSEIKKYLLCLGNISGDFSANNMKKKNRIKWVCARFFYRL